MDVLAAGHDHILLAAPDEQRAFLIDASEVTRNDLVIAEHCLFLGSSKYAVTAFGERPRVLPVVLKRVPASSVILISPKTGQPASPENGLVVSIPLAAPTTT